VRSALAVSGGVILQAAVKDEDATSPGQLQPLVAGKDDWWFEARNDDRIDVIPKRSATSRRKGAPPGPDAFASDGPRHGGARGDRGRIRSEALGKSPS